jgi:glycerol kinase
MAQDSGITPTTLRVDGGMVRSEPLMQFQSDILGIDVVRPRVTETTALGAAYAAGLATGFWSGTDELRAQWEADKTWHPAMGAEQRAAQIALWCRAVEKSLGWIEG